MFLFTFTLSCTMFIGLIINTVNAQVPQKISYQAVARDASGNILTNQAVRVRLTIHQSTPTGTIQFQEIQSTTTDAYGRINIFIGDVGSLITVTWNDGEAKYLQTEFDPTGAGAFINMGTSKFQSVPYAMVSGTTQGLQNNTVSSTAPSSGQVLKFNGSQWAPGTDNSNTYNAGTGLSLAGTTFNSVWTTSGSNIYNNNSANVGVGTATPGQKLTVDGTFGILEGGTAPTYHTIFQGGDQMGNITYTLPKSAGTNGQVLSTDAIGNLSWTSPSSLSGSGSATQVAFWNGSNSLSSSSSLYWDDTNSRLGIGITAPTQQLEISQSVSLPHSSGSTIGVIYKGSLPFLHDYNCAGHDGYNVFLGINAGNFTMSGGLVNDGSYNTAIGYNCSHGLSAGTRNTAVGANSMVSCSSGSDNIAIGYFAMNGTTIGSNNTALGISAGHGLVSGNYNCLMGTVAGQSLNASSYNTILGSWAGSNLMNGNDNIILGANAGNNLSSGSNNIIIGDNMDVGTTVSNKLNIGGIIGGDMSTHMVGIGTYNPSQRFEVYNGNVLLSNAGTASELRFAEPSAGGSNYTAFRAQAQSWDVTYTLPPSDGTSMQVLQTNGSGSLYWGTITSPLAICWSLTGNNGTDPSTNYLGTSDAKDLVIKANATERMRVLSGGEVHVGDASNYSKFEADGTLEFDGTATVWNDFSVPAIAGKPGTVYPEFNKFRDDGSGSTGVATYLYQHKDGVIESLYFILEMPHDYKEGTPIHPHIHWAPVTSGTGTVAWGMEYTWVDKSAAFDPTAVATASSAIGGSQYKHTISTLASLTPGSSQGHFNSVLMVRLYRNNIGGVDTYLDKVALLSMDVAYEANTVGSRTEFSK